MNKIKWIVVHHSGGSDSAPLADSSNFTFKQCEELHKKNFNFRSSLGFWTGYQYVIEKSGKIYQARRDDEEGAHTKGRNTDSIGIMVCGNFDAFMPTTGQIEALRGLLRTKSKEYGISKDKIVPHRKFAKKTCWGRKLPDDWASKLLPMTINITAVNYTDAVALNEQIIKFSRGRIDARFTLLDYPTGVTSGMLTQDQAYKLADKLNPQTPFLILCYPQNPTATKRASYYYPKLDICISTSPMGGDAKGMVFEIAHQLQYFYQEHRQGNPPIQVADHMYPSDEFIYAKFDSIMPYLQVFETWSAVENMKMTWEQIQKLCLAVFHREADEGMRGYVGLDVWKVLEIWTTSKEFRYYTPVFETVKSIENAVRNGQL